MSARSLLEIATQATNLDMAVLEFVAAARLASGKQLIRRFWLTGSEPSEAEARAGRRALRRLADWRVLDPLPRRVGGVRSGSAGIVYGVGPSGSRLLVGRGLRSRRLGTPGDRHINHTLAITELAVSLHEANASDELDLIEVQLEPACWRAFPGPLGGRPTLKPDLFVRIGVGAMEDRWFVEVDLATEARATIAAKVKRYLAHYRSGVEQREYGVYPRVLWAVPDERRAEQISDVLRSFPVENWRLFSVCVLGQVVRDLAAEAAR
jgi:hypothetical protein